MSVLGLADGIWSDLSLVFGSEHQLLPAACSSAEPVTEIRGLGELKSMISVQLVENKQLKDPVESHFTNPLTDQNHTRGKM